MCTSGHCWKVTISRLHYMQETGKRPKSLHSHLAGLEMCVCKSVCLWKKMGAVRDAMATQWKREVIKEKVEGWFRGWIIDFDEGLDRKTTDNLLAAAFLLLQISDRESFCLGVCFWVKCFPIVLFTSKKISWKSYGDLQIQTFLYIAKWSFVISSMKNNRLSKNLVSPSPRLSFPHHPLPL